MNDDMETDICLSTDDDIAALAEQYKETSETIGEVMLMIEAKNRGKDEATIFNMMEERLLNMKEAIETGVDDGSTGPSGISGGDKVKMHHYIN